MNDELRNCLIEVAKTGKTRTYSVIAPMIGLNMTLPEDRGEISVLLCEI